MSQILIEDNKLKSILKDVIIELLIENKDLFQKIIKDEIFEVKIPNTLTYKVLKDGQENKNIENFSLEDLNRPEL